MEQLLRRIVLIMVTRQFIRLVLSGRINLFRLARNVVLLALSLAASALIGWLLIEEEERQRGHLALRQQEAADDLTLIDGIGDTYARALNSLGITRFSQLALQDPLDLSQRMSSRVSAERIRSEDWIGQARQFSGQPRSMVL